MTPVNEFYGRRLNLNHGRTKSILDILIPESKPALTTEELFEIRYVKKKKEELIYGAPILQSPSPQCNGHSPRHLQVQTRSQGWSLSGRRLTVILAWR
jgi:hypothetical protein